MNHSKPRHVKNVYGFWKKLRRKLEDKIIFKKIENRIISDIKNLFEQEGVEDYYKPVSVGNLHSNDYIEYEMVIEIKPYQSKNTLIKLNHSWNIS